MPNPLKLIVPKILKSGEQVYKRGNRRVSKSAYRSQQWRLGGGAAGTAQRRATNQGKEIWYRNKWGAPPAGQTWVHITTKYPERFEPYIDELEGL